MVVRGDCLLPSAYFLLLLGNAMLMIKQPVGVSEGVDPALDLAFFFGRESGIEWNADIAVHSGVADPHNISDVEPVEELVKANR